MLDKLKTTLSHILNAAGTISLYEKRDYRKYISTPAECNARAWKMTGDALRKAIDEVGARHGHPVSERA